MKIDDIQNNRNRIDEIDKQILDLLNQRASLSLQIRESKNKSQMPLFCPEREAAIIRQLIEANNGPIYGEDVNRIFKLIMKVMRELPDATTDK